MVKINDFPDGRLEVRWKGRSLLYSAFDKLQRVSHAAIVENKRLGEILKRFPAEVNRGIPKGQVGSESMRIDSPLGGEPCAARIPVKCEYESLDLLKREHRGGKPPSSWRSAQVPQLDGCSTGKQSVFLGQNHAEEAFLRWSGMRSGYSLLSLSSRI
jgi:hypothetical protein